MLTHPFLLWLAAQPAPTAEPRPVERSEPLTAHEAAFLRACGVTP